MEKDILKSEAAFDVVVIGAGPAGYVHAIRQAQYGKKVACIDLRANPGGTCLNIGCIPSKSLLQSSHEYSHAKNHIASFGVLCDNVQFDLEAMMNRKKSVVEKLGKGILSLFKKNGVQYYSGIAEFMNPKQLLLRRFARDEDAIRVMELPSDADDALIDLLNGVEFKEEMTIRAEIIVIATGSYAAPLNGLQIDEKSLLSSTGALSLSSPPEKMAIIGAGAIGLEMASAWSRLGSKVTVLEYARPLVSMDNDVATEMTKILNKQGIEIISGAKFIEAKPIITNSSHDGSTKYDLIYDAQGQNKVLSDVDVILIATGRRPRTRLLKLDQANIVTDERGFIVVDDNYQTSVESIYAIGDVRGRQMLAHKASSEASVLADKLNGVSNRVNYGAIPSVVYTLPEVATVGATEDDLQACGIKYKVSKSSLEHNARAMIMNATAGFFKIITDERTNELLGASIIAPNAGDMIQEFAIALEFRASGEDIAMSTHSHPSISEIAHSVAEKSHRGESVH